MDPNRPKTPDDYRDEMQRYRNRYITGPAGTTEATSLFGLQALVTAVLVAVGTTVRFVLRSWIRWWRTEPRGAALYTWAWAVAATAWLTWTPAPGHAALAGAALWVRLAIAIAGALVMGGIIGAFLAKWRMSRRKSNQAGGL